MIIMEDLELFQFKMFPTKSSFYYDENFNDVLSYVANYIHGP